jgi:hypothetical protein
MTGLWGGFRERRHSQPLFEHGPPHQHTEPVSRQHERPTASAAWRQMSTPLRRGPAVSPYSTGAGAPRRCQRLRLRAQAGAVQHPHEGGSRQSPSPAAPGFRIGRAASVRTRPVPSSPSPGGCKPWCRCARSDACFPLRVDGRAGCVWPADSRLGTPSQLRRRACFRAVACRRPTCAKRW